MGHPDGAHTHGSGGSRLGEVLAILLAVALLGPAVAAAVAELVQVLLIVAAVLAGVGAVGLAAFIAVRVRRGASTRTLRARVVPPARPAQPLPPAQPAIERPQEIHLHLHGVSAEDIVAILSRREK
jgi:hypothetical protein